MVTGDTTQVQGRGSLHIQISGLQTVQDVWIAKIENECMLGLDFLGLNGCVLGVYRLALRGFNCNVRGARSSKSMEEYMWLKPPPIPARSEALIMMVNL